MTVRGACRSLVPVRRVAAAIATLGLVSCQTAAPTEPVPMPVVLAPLFTTCQPADGAAALQVFQDGGIVGSADAEWVAKAAGDWDLELTNAVGSTMLAVSRRGDRIATSGPLAARVPRVGVETRGFLEVDGHLTGIKAGEVPCILAFGFPRSWLDMVEAVEVKDKNITVQFADGVRRIDLETPRTKARLAEGACATLAWRTFLFLRHEVVYCETGRRVGTLRGIGDYTLRWAKIDER